MRLWPDSRRKLLLKQLEEDDDPPMVWPIGLHPILDLWACVGALSKVQKMLARNQVRLARMLVWHAGALLALALLMCAWTLRFWGVF